MKANDIRVEEIRRFRYSFLPASVWYTASRKDARLDLFILKTAAFQLEKQRLFFALHPKPPAAASLTGSSSLSSQRLRGCRSDLLLLTKVRQVSIVMVVI